MSEMMQANWLAFALALLIGLAVAWWLFGRAATPPKREHRPDVLDEGAAPAQRNQALIDAAPAAQFVTPPAMAGTLGGVGEIVAIAAQDEIDAAVPERVAEPVVESEPVPTVTAGDDLSRIKGLGPKLQALLPTLGIVSYAQIAALTEADLAELDLKLGAFAGRPTRDGWVEQAKLLSAGDDAGYEAKFGKL
jgi:predicted flap endonuclease-1-like 5' DNA nuclease